MNDIKVVQRFVDLVLSEKQKGLWTPSPRPFLLNNRKPGQTNSKSFAILQNK
ncbi:MULTISPECIES: hypothetical protein [Methylocaldum]|jgi:hypothetical protein|uniref:hypothetical protein n=1 Tax=unclassified Methylocaldum TaxID=2622260 RepID=UPI001AE40B66|nr:hypothetical protein [Methylocaldum sp. RMAD-M]MBP1148195.1 hypothetical protein [Methylocaldum sp. RMAD-M]